VGQVTHTVTADPTKAIRPADVTLPAGVQPWDSGNVDAGQSYSYIFSTPGTYRYVCIPHEMLGMIGTITVTN
jgi:plastocyanin